MLKQSVLFGLLLFVLCFLIHDVWSNELATPEQEALDERHDAEILRAVINSMAEWEKRHKHVRRKRAPEKKVCYDELGCFEASGPFHYLDTVPSPPAEIGTQFLMYPPRNDVSDIVDGRRNIRSSLLDSATPGPDEPPLSGDRAFTVPSDNMTMAWDWVKHGHFNTSLPTKVVVHGFGSSCDLVWVYELRSSLIRYDNCNMICVDWAGGAIVPNYVRAATNTRLVGAQLARLLRGLHTHAGLPLNRIHLIGFSLGAHVAGFAGSELDGNISRITGLDPAGPLFESQDPRARLDSTDATFVDVIHSNGDNLILGGLGSWQPMGHVDFYPNGGRVQKGCSHLFLGAITDAIWSRTDAEGQSLCNHRRAYKFFVESISPACHFPAFPCDSFEDFVAGKCYPCSSERTCGNMGYYADRSAGRGQLYLMTRDEEPFCVHQYQVKIESSAEIDDKIEKSYGKIVLTILGETGFNETFTMTHKDDEELVVSGSLSKLLILNPYLEEPVGVEILYIAYSGWLSSGLKKWRIDKILFTDSFGKSLSVCQKGLYLKSEHPVSLPLYPGHCNPPKPQTDDSRVLEDRISLPNIKQPKNEQNKTKDDKRVKVEITSPLPDDLKLNKKSANYDERLLPTPIVHVDNKELLTHENIKKFDEKETNIPIRNMMDFFNLPWRPLLEYTAETSNSLDGSTDEKEASRAFNIRAVRIPANNNHTTKNVSKTNTSHKEIFEPVLKPQHITNKIARSQNLDRTSKNEISEPLLLSTTSRSFSSSASTKPQRKLDISMNKNTADVFQKHWSPAERLNPPVKITADNNWSSPWSNKGIKDSEISESSNIASHIIHNESSNITDLNSPKGSGLVAITVQFLPHRLANMLDQAERYARMTLLPFISAATPKIITDFVQSITNSQPKYMPLYFEESQTSNPPSLNKESTPDNENQINDRIQNIKSLNIRPPILSDNIFVNETASINNNSTEIINQNRTELNNTEMASSLTINTTEIPPNKTEGISNRVFVVYPQNNNTLSNNETKTEKIELNKGEILIESPESLSKTSDDILVEEHENLQTQSSGLTILKSDPSKVIKSLNIGEILPTDITSSSTIDNLVANKDFFENYKPSKKIYINLPVYEELSQSSEHKSKSDNDNTNVEVQSTLPFKYIPLNFKDQNDKA